jgi:hypothetical protein
MFGVFLRKFFCCNIPPVLLQGLEGKGLDNFSGFLEIGEVVVDPLDLEGIDDLGVVVVAVHLKCLTDKGHLALLGNFIRGIRLSYIHATVSRIMINQGEDNKRRLNFSNSVNS